MLVALDRKLLAQLRSLDDTPKVRGGTIVRAAFGYPGAKSRSISELLHHLPYRKVFIDGFGGSGCVTAARHAVDLEVFNEQHAGISAFFRCMRDATKCKKVIDWLEKTVPSRDEWEHCEQTWKCDWNDDVERAARWYYCVQHSFASKGWSFGRSVSGKSQAGKIHSNLDLFWPLSNRFRRVYVENQDWRVLMRDYNNDKNGDDIVWYFDPPYWGTIGIYDHEMRPEHHYEFAERCMHLNGFVAVSGYDHPKHPYNEYKWDKKVAWEVSVTMTGLAFTDTNNLGEYADSIKRGKAQETLWIRGV
jgi:DNA adenine methylase